MSLRQQFKLILSWFGSVFMLAFGTTANSAELNLSDIPLFLGTQIDPNVFFMMDDSGSMDWEVLAVAHHYYMDYWSSSDTVGLVDDGLIYIDPTDGDTSLGNCETNKERDYIYSSWSTSNDDNVYQSCNRAAVEDAHDTAEQDWRILNGDMNILYYNPASLYSPWIGFSNATFTNARSNPQPGTDGYSMTRNLTGFEYHVWIDDHGIDFNGGSTVEGPHRITDTPNGLVDSWDSHTKYTVNSSDVTVNAYTVPAAATVIALPTSSCNNDDADDPIPFDDCFGTTVVNSTINGAATDPWGRTVTQIKQNIANWYQYHRRRSFVSKSAVTSVVLANSDFRFGLSQINDYAVVFEEVPGPLIEDYDTHNAALLQSMYSWEWESQGTPLRRGLERVGRYFDDYSGYSYDDPIISECQQNYSVLFTDGYWGGSSPYTSEIGDEDGDGDSDNLSDVALYFYEKDLSPLDNDVPTTPIDPAEHQHMVTFTVAFGVSGNLVDTDDDGYPNPELAENGAWHDGNVNSDPEKIDDLWHASFNSKAFFVSAQSSTGVAQAIGEALLEIADRVGSAASVATNTGSLNAGSKLFQARFDSSDWKGQLLAFQINLDGTIEPNPVWEAGARVNSQHYDTGREIITYNPLVDFPVGGVVEGAGIPFRFPSDYNSPSATAEMNSGQIAELMTGAPYALGTMDAGEISANQTYGYDIVNFLRGDETNELAGQNFRLRNSVLGDIVNSDPKFVDVPNAPYPDALEAKSYNDFKTDNASRQGVVYVGANDGMVHAFNDDTGDELFAYVPNIVYENLDYLADTDYEHRYFVDGGPNIIDVFMPNMNDPMSATNGLWRTVIAGGLSGGGQGVYALDVTEPSTFDEANADDLILFEFDDSDDADLGYTYGKVQIAKMNDDTWAAVFGNGYNNTEADGTASTTGHAVLYIVDIETGDLIKKIDTEAGSVGTPNGLNTPLLIDVDSNFTADYIYAGDAEGNMWKFDVTSSNSSSWDSAWSSAGTPDPLFTTPTGQPITSQPQATFHPDNLEGFMVYFGTGKYLETGDNVGSGQTTQSFYGIWDKNNNGGAGPTITTGNLLKQEISNQFSQAFDTDDDGVDDETFLLRNVTDNEIQWASDLGWYIDLIPVEIEGSANAANFGERQISSAIVRNGRVIFTTLIPSTVECEFGGTSFLMELDFRDGSALEFPAFDLNGDGEYDSDDTDASGRASDVGIMPTVSILADEAQDVAFGSGASGDIDVIELSVGDQAYGRQSWRQLE
ncbi:MAG: pilus assembly protein [Pseudomonadales bacterium]|nr:pilus assembly protein [Pseudomonadales bacterium]